MKASSMDQERTLLIVAVGVAVAVGCFVLWGPSTFRSKKKKGHVVGLMNLGHTCFLNTLLQALASCPSVMDWLMLHKNEDHESLIASLRMVLLVLNGDHDAAVCDPYPPTEVLVALKRHNWVISPGEQDAHELFHVLLETLEEEMTNLALKIVSLSDLLEQSGLGHGDDITDVEYRLKNNTPNADLNCYGDRGSSLLESRFRPIRRIRLCGNSEAAPSPPRPSQTNPPPFRGMLTSQLRCTVCGVKSALRFDKFDTLSLPLPTSVRRHQLTLQMLLDNFVSTEIVKDVTCVNCSKNKNEPVRTTATKTLNFGKLPKCLCLHIVRTTWNKDGSPWKREDYVDFPEFLVMDNYTHSQVQRNARRLKETLNVGSKGMEEKESTLSYATVPNGIHKTGESSWMQTSVSESQGQSQQSISPSTSSGANHMYRLKAVVVHTGDVHSGHFITYRKGPVKSLIRHRMFSEESKMEHLESRESTRWFYTSDVVVKRATLCDVLLSNAYMLFYEKCVNPQNEHILR